MSIQNFSASAIDTALHLLSAGFIVCERKGDLVAAFERVDEAGSYARFNRGVNVHFPNGHFLDSFAASISSEADFWAISQRKAYLETVEEADKIDIVVNEPTPADRFDRKG